MLMQPNLPQDPPQLPETWVLVTCIRTIPAAEQKVLYCLILNARWTICWRCAQTKVEIAPRPVEDGARAIAWAYLSPKVRRHVPYCLAALALPSPP